MLGKIGGAFFGFEAHLLIAWPFVPSPEPTDQWL